MPRVFLSHNSKDKTIVKKVGEYLTRCLLKVWLDDSEMPGGAHLSSEITKGIHGSNYFLPFISNNYCKSDWCFTELRKASNYAVENKIKILPIAFYGRSPNWLTAAMAVPLFNKRSIFIYNSPANEYICAYSISKDNMPGKVLKTK